MGSTKCSKRFVRLEANLPYQSSDHAAKIVANHYTVEQFERLIKQSGLDPASCWSRVSLVNPVTGLPLRSGVCERLCE